VLRKDLLLEWRTLGRTVALVCFGVTILLLFSFSVGPHASALRQHASAYLWLTVLLGSTLLLERSLRLEVESGALEMLRMAPLSPGALFYGKALSNTLQLLGLAAVMVPLVLVLCDTSLVEHPIWLLAVLVLGTAGLAAPGTLYAGLTASLSTRQVLLPLLLFPLVVPALLASVKATALVLQGDPMDQLGSWLWLLVCFDLVYWSLSGVLFGKVMES
jgi:heme exporter protein B